MSQPIKAWKKLTERKILLDKSGTPPEIKEWIVSIQTIQNDLYETYEFNENKRMISYRIIREDCDDFYEFDEKGNKIYSEHIFYHINSKGDIEEVIEDSDRNRIVEKLEYDETGRAIRINFIINGKRESYLEFRYDYDKKIATTFNYENDKLEFIEEEIHVSEDESISNIYDSDGKLISRTEHKSFKVPNVYVRKRFDSQGKLIEKIEEVRGNMNEIKEQKIFDVNNNLIKHIIFGEDDEYGYRKSVTELEYINNKLVKKLLTVYEYEY